MRMRRREKLDMTKKLTPGRVSPENHPYFLGEAADPIGFLSGELYSVFYFMKSCACAGNDRRLMVWRKC